MKRILEIGGKRLSFLRWSLLRAVVDDSAGPNADVDHAAGVLRMFGVDRDEASGIASGPLPTSAVA